jgi:hypothetical protein
MRLSLLGNKTFDILYIRLDIRLVSAEQKIRLFNLFFECLLGFSL